MGWQLSILSHRTSIVCSDRNRQNQSSGAPDPALKKQRDRHRQRIQMDAFSDHRRKEQIGGDQMQKHQHRVNSKELPDGVELIQANERRRNKRQHHAEIRHKIENSRNKSGEERVVRPMAQKKSQLASTSVTATIAVPTT